MTWYPARLVPSLLLAPFLLACAHRSGTNDLSVTPDSVSRPPAGSGVTTEDQTRTATSLDQLLQGRISGVTVTPAVGGGIVVRIGGPKSFMSREDPLFIVDGTPIDLVPNGTLSWLNPHDIESIRVLKDPSETAIYGVRGANGVVIIRTKGSH